MNPDPAWIIWSLHPSFKPLTPLYHLQLQNPAVIEGRTSLAHSRSVNLTNLLWFHQHSSLSFHPLPSEELLCDFPFQKMPPKWRPGEHCYSPGCSDDMRRSLLWAPWKRGGDEQEVMWVQAGFFIFIFPLLLFSQLSLILSDVKAQIGPSSLPPVYITELIKERMVIKKWWSGRGLWQEKLILFNKKRRRMVGEKGATEGNLLRKRG